MNVHQVSFKGLREQNEDKHDIILNTDNHDPSIKNVNFFAIYDGHGGRGISKHVYENLSKYFVNKKVQYPLNRKFVYDVYDHIQKNLKNNNSAYHSGTTALVVINYKLHDETYLNILNTGDCRCILARDNFAMPLTKDHKPNIFEERHRIEALGGNITFDGVDWRIKDLSVSRAFGDIDATPYVTHRPDVFRYKLDKTDKFFVMGCDGLWDVMNNDEVVNFVLLNCYSNAGVRINKNINIAKKLGEYALQKGSTDNITIIIVFLQ